LRNNINNITRLLRTLYGFGLIATLCSVSACSFDNIVKVDDPESEQNLNRDQVRSRDGAIGMYNSAVGQLANGVSEMSKQVAQMTDELAIRPTSSMDYAGNGLHADARIDSTNRWGIRGISSEGYTSLHIARVRVSQARTVLKALNDSTLKHLIAATYAIEGYAIVILAENICSGNPLSEVPFEGDLVLGMALSTEQLFAIAASKFDSALAVTHDSTRILTLARVGSGRAYMGLGQYDKAAAAVADVQPGDIFQLTYSTSPAPGQVTAINQFWTDSTTDLGAQRLNAHEVINREGANGLVWYTTPAAMDPRVPITTRTDETGTQFTFPARQRKRVIGNQSFPLARWVEARMIQAEYYLSIGDARWLDALNEARRTVGLVDTTDPGSVEQRVNLVFRERAFWFYLEATRLADYRRLVRQYGRAPSRVYPSGNYPRSPNVPFYGDAYVLSPPASEYELNSRYNGCLNKNP